MKRYTFFILCSFLIVFATISIAKRHPQAQAVAFGPVAYTRLQGNFLQTYIHLRVNYLRMYIQVQVRYLHGVATIVIGVMRSLQQISHQGGDV